MCFYLLIRVSILVKKFKRIVKKRLDKLKSSLYFESIQDYTCIDLQNMEQALILQRAAAVIKKTSMISLRLQIMDFIQTEIQAGLLRPGDQIPSENNLAEALKISRMTVRSAFDELVITGVLTRMPGKGTFVTPAEQKEDVGSAGVVAFITGDISGLMMPHVFTGIQSVMEKRRYRIILCNTRWDVFSQTRYIQSFHQDHHVRGIIIAPVTGLQESAEMVNMLRQGGIPFVEVVFHTIDERENYVIPDNAGGAYKLIKHLIDLGHTRIGTIWSGPLNSPVHDRLKGYRTALEEAGVPFGEELVIRLDSHLPFIDNPEKLETILSVRPRPTAVFCQNDVLALAFLKVCREKHICVPEDLAVVGFDNLQPARYAHPSLTTVTYDPQLLGMRAAEILLDRIEQPTDEVRQEVIETQLVVRESCGAKMRTTEKRQRAIKL